MTASLLVVFALGLMIGAVVGALGLAIVVAGHRDDAGEWAP